jgi:hypothetical protein
MTQLEITKTILRWYVINISSQGIAAVERFDRSQVTWVEFAKSQHFATESVSLPL